MNNLSNEMLQKAKECKTVEELLNLAKENDFPLTEEQATEKFNEWNKTGELADEELGNVAGGGCGGPDGENAENLKEGDLVRFKNGYLCERCKSMVFKMDSSWGECSVCGIRVKIYNYDDITKSTFKYV